MVNVKWKHGASDVMTWASENTRNTFFERLDGISFNNCKPVRNNVLKVQTNYDATQNYNYIWCRNRVYTNGDNYTTYDYFAFIVGRRYVNNNCTELVIDIDSWTTYQFDIKWGSTFIHRAIVPKAQDTLGAYLAPESVGYGDEYVYSDTEKIDKEGTETNLLTNWQPVVWCSLTADQIENMSGTIEGKSITTFNKPSGTILGSIKLDSIYYRGFKIGGSICGYFRLGSYVGKGYDGLTLFIPVSNDNYADSTIVRIALDAINTASSGAVMSVQWLPRECIQALTTTTTTRYSANCLVTSGSTKFKNLFGGYTPRNKKLYTYPYCGITIDTLSAGTQDYKLENFNTFGNCKFRADIAPTQNGSITLYPKEYKGITGDHVAVAEKIQLNEFPTMAYVSDYYSSWLALQGGMNYLQSTQSNKLETNQIEKKKLKSNMVKTVASDVGSTVSGMLAGGAEGAVTGGVAGAVAGGAIGSAKGAVSLGTDIANYTYDKQLNAIDKEQIALDYNAMLSGAQHMGNYTGIGNSSAFGMLGMFDFYVYTFSIKKQFAVLVDHYFDMYGYTINDYATPSNGGQGNLLTGRSKWNYLKTAGANIWGDIPNDDLVKIINMFDSGVTLWHEYESMYNYTQANN